jgi:hypothetical protein
MTPTKAIKAECRVCKNGHIYECKSVDCKLNLKSLSPLKRIKAHCISCVPEQSIYGVKGCTGRLLNGNICPLHPYREGRNPKIKGNPEALKRYLKTKKETAFLASNFVYFKSRVYLLYPALNLSLQTLFFRVCSN